MEHVNFPEYAAQTAWQLGRLRRSCAEWWVKTLPATEFCYADRDLVRKLDPTQ